MRYKNFFMTLPNDKKVLFILEKKGMTKQEIDKFGYIGNKLIWLPILDFYLKKSKLESLVVNLLRLTVFQIKDVDLANKMTDFLNYPNNFKANILYDKIKDDFSKNLIEEFVKLVRKIGDIFSFREEKF